MSQGMRCECAKWTVAYPVLISRVQRGWTISWVMCGWLIYWAAQGLRYIWDFPPWIASRGGGTQSSPPWKFPSMCRYLEFGAERNVFHFIRETVDNGVNNVALSVGLYRVLEKLPNIRLLSMSECVCMNAASSLGTIQNIGTKRRFKF